ncbi:hypothetical protein AG0111_0g987 [Alternaria gaisen]|uniref:Uncharacterized protein n=1 Tax=Alternaria gaisen TaxID=167740 RepID=A0ACB6G0W7_9PLEO|nr:hypothetical protein AG0111_0g987 [Alternaria gaisen]
MSLALVSVVLRFWAHTKSGNQVGADDALIIPALICIVGMVVTEVIGTELGEMAQHQTNIIGPDGPVYTKQLEANYTLQLLALVSLGFSKTSVLCFYRRVFYVYPRFLFVNNILIVVIVAWAVSLFVILLQCRDPRTLWTTFEHARVECVEPLPFYYAVSISGFITDIAILVSPIPVIYQLQMHWKTRAAAACILLLGAIVCGAGIAHFVTFIEVGRNVMYNFDDITYFTTPVFAWSMIESSLAVVGANLPLLRPLLHRIEHTCSRVGSSLPSLRSKCPASSTATDSFDVESEAKIEEAKVGDEISIRSYASFELPPHREGALRPEDLLQIPPQASIMKQIASPATSYSSWSSDEWENI